MPPVRLDYRLAFPDATEANADGLVAIGGDMSVERLLLAYRNGIFPWTVNPISWWSPDPRGIFELENFHVSRRLAQLRRQCAVEPTPIPSKEGSAKMQAPLPVPLLGAVRGGFTVTRNRAFRAVIEGCAAPGPGRGRSWISRQFIAAYTALRQAGHAHSVGGLFAGESMFHRAGNASKIALVHLVEHLRERGFVLFDIQMVTPATHALGAVEISRSVYLQRLRAAVKLKCAFR